MLDGEYFVHTFETEPAFAIEEVGDVSLLESALLGQMAACELPTLDSLQKRLTEVLLQALELHNGGSIAGTKLANSYRIVTANI